MTRTIRGVTTFLAVALAALILAACGTTTTPTVNSVAIDGGDFDLQVGTSATLTATVDVSDGASQDVTWSSSDDGVATVDPDTGDVTAQGAAGQTAEITATSDADDTVSDTVTVTLVAAPVVVDSVTIDGGDFDLRVDDTTTLTATVAPSGAPQDVTWSSSDDAVATVDASTGEVTATGTAGQTATITATSDADATVSGTVTVTLEATPVTTVSNLAATVVLGSQVDLTWTAENADSFDVVCDDGAGGPATDIDTALAGTATGTTIAIPASTCQTVRVHASGADNDDSAEVVLSGVVLNGDDAGPGSLREVYDAAAAAGDDVIGFASDVTEVVLSSKDFLGSDDAHMILGADVSISGPTASPVTVRSDDTLAPDSANIQVQRTRVFFVPAIATVQLDGLVISGGTFIAEGGGVRNDGTLTISNSVIQNNRAWYRGGGIANLGTLTIESSTIQNNQSVVTEDELTAVFACIDDVDRTCSAGDPNYLEFGEGGAGGGLYNQTGATTIVDSAIDGNTAIFSGGGIYVLAGSVDATDTTISNNVASDASSSIVAYNYGGGVANVVDAGFTMTGGSVTANTSADVGGGLANGNDTGAAFLDLTMTLTDVSVTGNTAGTFGGGYIHYFEVGSPAGPDGTYAVVENGTTDVNANTAPNDPNRSFADVTP